METCVVYTNGIVKLQYFVWYEVRCTLVSYPGSSVGRALCLWLAVSWVRVPPRAAPFSFEKCVFLGVIDMHLLCSHTLCLFCSICATYLCHSTEYWGLTLPCVVLCCVVDLEPCLLSCPGSSVGRALCVVSGVSWVRVPPSCPGWCCYALALHPLIHASDSK